MIEKEVVATLTHPMVYKLEFTFQDKENLYFGLEYCKGGSLAEFLELERNFISFLKE